jgi:multiple sugar transport system substrate-binding protein
MQNAFLEQPMAQIDFSSIGEPAEAVTRALQQFEQETGHRVKVHVMQWESAWPELLSYALHGNGPDISHIGSTWVGSLVKMNALRPFQPGELQTVGGAPAFLPACWNSVILAGDESAWALPWTAYTYLLCYRRDLLARARVDESSAFKNTGSLLAALEQLLTAGELLPWVIPTGRPHVDTIHIVASWIWAAGGDFIAEDGKTPLFTQSKAMDGLKAFYELGRVIPPQARNWTPEQALESFCKGEAAMTVNGYDEPYFIQRGDIAVPVVRQNLGVIAMPGQPWVGGDNLVVWQHAQDDPRREKAAVDLALHLVSREVQTKYCQGDTVAIPTRLDALSDFPLPGSELTRQVEYSLREGRSYRPIALWGRVETQLSAALNHVWLDIFNGMSVELAIMRQLEPMAQRLEAALNN